MAAYPRIDGHIHLWADDHAKYPMGSLIYPGDKAEMGPGPAGTWVKGGSAVGQLDYYKQGTAAALFKAQAEVGVHAAHAIQVVFHGYDDRYIEDCIEATPLRLRGSHVCDPASTPEKEVARIERLHSQRGYTGIRFKPNLWEDAGRGWGSYNDDMGQAVAKACGERGMPVAILSRFTMDGAEAEQIEKLAADFPSTQIILDHFGGGPTPGALQPAPHWNRLLALSKFDNVAIKVSGWHPHGKTGSNPIPPGGKDHYETAGSACLELLGKYGASRLMYGTNFPEPAVYADETKGYQRQWRAFDSWCADHVSKEEAGLMAGGTCGRLYHFDCQALLDAGPAQAMEGRL